MIEFTGERFIPTVAMEEEIAVEHVQRYLSISDMVQGKIVLDAACGEGYGAALISESAEKCYGVDSSKDVIRHAKNKYCSSNLEYLATSVNNLPFKDNTFDILISFETIEHLDEGSQKSFMSEIKRTLKNEGVLIISTPDKILYSEGNRPSNKFHLKEFYRDEFYSFLKRYFTVVDFFYQNRQAATILSQSGQEYLKVVHSNEFNCGKYIVAICADVELPNNINLNSVVYDLDHEYIRNVNRIVELQQEVEKLGTWGTGLNVLNDEKSNIISREKRLVESLRSQLVEAQEIFEKEKEQSRDTLEKIKEEAQKQILSLEQECQENRVSIQSAGKEISELRDLGELQESQINELRDLGELQESQIKSLHVKLNANREKAALYEGWFYEIEKALHAIFFSFRWKAGDRLASFLELLLFRFREKTAKDHLEGIFDEYHAYLCSRNDASQFSERKLQLRNNDSRWSLFVQLALTAIKNPIHTARLLNIERLKNFYITFFKQDSCIQKSIFHYYINLYKDSSVQIPIKYREEGNLIDVGNTRGTLPKGNVPLVSIIIPVFNQWEFTEKCIRSVIQSSEGLNYEIILADDCSSDRTINVRDAFPGIKVVNTPQNYGFLRNCNNASLHAGGEFIVFLNNDTVVHANWLRALLEVLGNDSAVGMTGSMLIYPDGKLQEAGGIIWSDASGWNYGRCDDPEKPEYNYVKEVDYISGASIMIRSSLWKEIGGFDEQFIPAYYEDTDLAFEVRSRNFKVMYTPFSKVTHYEGKSHGTDVNIGVKKNQEINRQKFFTKWQDVLEKDHCPNGENVFLVRDKSFNKKTMLVIDHYVPHYDKDAGSRSTLQYLQWLVRNGFNVKFLGDNFCQHEPYTSGLQRMGVEVLYGAWYLKKWKQWMGENGSNIDYIYIHRPHIATKYIDICRKMTDAKLIYFGHDLHYLRTERQYELEKDEILKKQAKEWKKKEFAIFEKVDVIFYPSLLEVKEVKKSFPDKVVKAIPLNIYDNIALQENRFEERKNLLFVGGFGHLPNLDAVLWFINEIFPLIANKNPQIQFIIVGSKIPDQILQLKSAKIVVAGEVSDPVLENIYSQCRLSVVPLRYGAGVKGKIVESLKMQLPVVTTDIGAEGLPEPQDYLKVATSREDFAEKVFSLYSDQDEWQKQVRKGVECVNRYFSPERVDEIWNEVIEMPSRD
jgi:O-antigen biosynthesis protein